MDTTESTGDFYEADLAFGEQRLGEMWEHETYLLRFNLPEGLSYREADTLAHQIINEIAERYEGAAAWGDLGREFNGSRTTFLSRKPGSTVSGATSHAEIQAIQEKATRGNS